MASNHTNAERRDTTEQIPEADLLEQQAALDPSPLTNAEPAIPTLEAAPVDEADQWEEQQPVPTAEADYPHDPYEGG